MNETIFKDFEPPTGVDPHMSNEVYHQISGLSKSGLAKLREAPAKYHWQYILGNREQETKAMTQGDAFHCLILEPEIFPNRFAVSPKFDGRTKEGKAGKAEFATANAGKSIINVDEHALLVQMAEAVHAHPAASYLLGLGGISEESFFWREDYTGSNILCKCRPDLRIPSKRILVDLKKTAKGARYDNFARTIWNMTYHMQAGHYLDGVSAALQEDYDEFIFIAVEDEPPFLAAVYQLDRDSIEMGRREARNMVYLYAHCLKNNYWPGYGDEIQLINLPRWAKETEAITYD